MPILDVLRRSAGRPVLIQLSGELDIATQSSFESQVSCELDRSSVVVDLSRVGFLAISALRSLLLVDRYATVRGRAVVFAEPPPAARRLLALAGLESVLVLRSTVVEACRELRVTPAELRTVNWSGDKTEGAA